MGLKDLFNKFASGAATVQPGVNDNRENADQTLLRAAEFNKIPDMQAALKDGANIDARAPNTGDTALIIAVREGHTAAADFILLQKPDLSPVNSFKQTALHVLLREAGEAAIAVRLVKSGAPLDGQDMHGNTPALWAARNGFPEVIEALMEKKADLTIRGQGEQTPLMQATETNRANIVKIMLTDPAAAGMDLADSNGMTGLMKATLLGNKAIVTAFLAADANFELKNNDGEKAIDIARADFSKRGGDRTILDMLEAASLKNANAFHAGVAHTKLLKPVRFKPKPATTV
ncbi:MAG: ankyrin repeat domain-containing protein [Micavibrio sp.]|nr:ankyrin repeat domain-containing protein [Micavibrio sp.]